MIRGSVFTVGALIALGGIGWGAISIMAGGMSDASQEGEDEANSGLWSIGVGGGLGAALMVGAYFLPG